MLLGHSTTTRRPDGTPRWWGPPIPLPLPVSSHYMRTVEYAHGRIPPVRSRREAIWHPQGAGQRPGRPTALPTVRPARCLPSPHFVDNPLAFQPHDPHHPHTGGGGGTARGGSHGTASQCPVARLVPNASGETDLGRRGVLLMVRRLMKRFGVAVSVAAVVLSLSASAAFAGEVKGPPTGGVSTSNDTAAPAHANSICAFSGLNDYTNGQSVSQVQTAADSFKYYGLPKGTPGEACRGGSNPDNPPN